jgi:hypothetical protein
VFSKLASDLDSVDTRLLPPCSLVTRAMSRAVMHPAQQYNEFIAGLTAERPWLHIYRR